MDFKDGGPVKKKSSNDVVRKKLEAELRATEEIARIKQNVIEKRLAVELASLEQEPPDGAKAVEGAATAQAAPPKPAPKAPPVAAEPKKARTPKKPPQAQEAEKAETQVEATTSAFTGVKLQKSPFSLRFRRSSDKGPKSTLVTPSFLTFSRKHQLPEFFTPCHPDHSKENEDDEEDGEEDEDTQPRRKGSFLKGVIQKWRKRNAPDGGKGARVTTRTTARQLQVPDIRSQVQEVHGGRTAMNRRRPPHESP